MLARCLTVFFQVRVADAVRTLLAAREGEHAIIPPGGAGGDNAMSKRRRQYEMARSLTGGGRPILVKVCCF